MVMERVLQALQISEETLRKTWDDFVEALSEESFYSNLRSWENLYEKVLKGRPREEKKAILYIIITLAIITANRFAKAVRRPNKKYLRKLKKSLNHRNFCVTIFNAGFIGGIVSLYNSVELTENLLNYIEQYETTLNSQNEKCYISDISDKIETILDAVCLGAIFGLQLLNEAE